MPIVGFVKKHRSDNNYTLETIWDSRHIYSEIAEHIWESSLRCFLFANVWSNSLKSKLVVTSEVKTVSTQYLTETKNKKIRRQPIWLRNSLKVTLWRWFIVSYFVVTNLPDLWRTAGQIPLEYDTVYYISYLVTFVYAKTGNKTQIYLMLLSSVLKLCAHFSEWFVVNGSSPNFGFNIKFI